MVKLWLIISRRMPQEGSTGTVANRMVPLPHLPFNASSTHQLFTRHRLSCRKQITGDVVRLAEVEQQNLCLAVAEALPVHPLHSLLRGICQQTRIVSWEWRIHLWLICRGDLTSMQSPLPYPLVGHRELYLHRSRVRDAQ